MLALGLLFRAYGGGVWPATVRRSVQCNATGEVLRTNATLLRDTFELVASERACCSSSKSACVVLYTPEALALLFTERVSSSFSACCSKSSAQGNRRQSKSKTKKKDESQACGSTGVRACVRATQISSFDLLNSRQQAAVHPRTSWAREFLMCRCSIRPISAVLCFKFCSAAFRALCDSSLVALSCS